MEKSDLFLNYIDKRIETHNERIDQAVQSGNHPMKTVCKTERAEADVIRAEFMRIFNKKRS